MTAVLERLSAPRRGTRAREHRVPPRARRRVLWLVVGGWALFCIAQLALAYGDARRGMREAASSRQAVQSEDIDATEAEVRMDRARHAFRAAHRRSSSPVLAPLHLVPVLGRQLRSFGDLTDTASRVAGVMATSTEAVGDILRQTRGTGAERVGVLRLLADQAVIAETALARVPLVTPDGLMEPLRRGWLVLERDVASTRATLRTTAEGLDGIAGILEGRHRYLVLMANNAEMRAGSGMFLSIGTIETAGGSLTMAPLRPAGELTLPGPGVSVEGDLRERWGWLEPGREWRNLATTPRFDTTAPLAARMWETLTGEHVDGVLALDVPLVAAILSATGPVAAGDGVLTEASVADRLLRDQYQGLDFDDPQAERREELGEMAAAVVAAVENGDYSPARLARGVAKAGRGRHLLAWSSEPGDQRTWETIGVAGSLRPTSLAVSILNRGGNKLDPFLEVEATLELHEVSDGTEATVRLKLGNHTPTGESPYVAGPHPDTGVSEGDYLGIVAVNLPGPATDIAVEGAAAPLSTGPDGPTQVVAVPLLLPRGSETTTAVRFRLPASQRSIEVVPSARVPAIRWQAGRDRWTDEAPKVLGWR